MAYINVVEWTPDQVTDWLKGLDDSMYNYVYSFTNNEVGGRQLLNIRPYELEQLGMQSIGHQEIVLEAVENLRNFHYNLDKENLQFMALHVATAARSLHRQLATHCDAAKIETQLLNDITRTIAAIKPLIGWLERTPFRGQLQFTEICRNMLRLGLEMATIAQRDRFVERPVEQIRSTAEKLERLANYIIQDITDPMLLQPASLNLVTLKKRESELGFNIESSYHGIHRVTDIKYNSPAHNSGKIEDGDEIVQINYQTVVGWRSKTVLVQLHESLPDVLLTLKKRPKHTKIYGQIYMQPYRLPSKKRAPLSTRWAGASENNATLASPPRPAGSGFLTVPDFNLSSTGAPAVSAEEKTNAAAVAAAAVAAAAAASSDTDSSCSDILTPDLTASGTGDKSTEKKIRLYYPKPRAMLQRRNTISGDELLYLGGGNSGIPIWHERKGGTVGAVSLLHAVGDPASPSLRDKSVSFGFGLDATPRPTTCIGIASGSVGSGKFNGEAKKLRPQQLPSSPPPSPLQLQLQQESATAVEKSKPGVSKVVRFDAQMKYAAAADYREQYTCNVENTILETFEPIPFADDEDGDEALATLCRSSAATDKAADIIAALDKASSAKSQTTPLTEAVNLPVIARRGRLDKSHSTPAYDNSGGEEESSEHTPPPPAIEPRKQQLPPPPIPPPRPRKQKDMGPPVVPVPPPKPAGLAAAAAAAAASAAAASTTAMTATTAIYNVETSASSSFLDLVVAAAPEMKRHETSSTAKHVAAVAASVVSKPPPPKQPDFPMEANELHTPTKTRTLTLKKKHSLIAKRRKINLKVLGTGDIQGHLYRRTKDRRGVTFWARLYFVMLDTNLYGFRSKDAPKASCVIFLPGFTVSLAKEVHSKPFAFKVYHSAKTFYFAAESQDALNQWVEFIRQSTLQPALSSSSSNSTLNAVAACSDLSAGSGCGNPKDLFSETDSSGDENESLITKNLCTPSPQGTKVSGSSKNASGTTPTTSKPDRRYLGSLRKLTKGSLPFKSSSNASEKKPSSDIPVPTDQYRSYRKVPGGSFGIQIGTNTPGYHDPPPLPLLQQQQPPPPTFKRFDANYSGSTVSAVVEKQQQQHMQVQLQLQPQPQPPPPPLHQRKLSISSSRSSIISNCESCLGPPSSPAPTPTPTLTSSTPLPIAITATPTISYARRALAEVNSSAFCDSSPGKSIKKIPYNFIHASNPNLVEFDFQTSKTLDYSLPKINPSNSSWDAHPNIQGFVTLKDLMLQKQEEEAQEMYNNRVLLGVEKKMDEQKRKLLEWNQANNKILLQQQEQQKQQLYQQHQQQQKSKTQNRSLPKTPDYEISFKPDDEAIKKTRSKEGLKLRDFGYELISGDEPLGGHKQQQHGVTSRQNSNISSASSGGEFHQHQQPATGYEQSWTSNMKSSSRQFLGGKSKKQSSCSSSITSADLATGFGDKRTGSFKKKGKLESYKTSTERLFNFNKSGNATTSSSMTMTLPLHKKTSNQSLESGAGVIKKSQTYNNDLKDKASAKYDAHRKNSAPMPIFSKLTFGASASSAASGSTGGSGKTSKEKRLLGSPLLHRTIFGTSSAASSGGIPATPSPTQTTCTGREYDREIFSQVIFPKVTSGTSTGSATGTHHHHHHHQNSHADFGGSSGRFRSLSSSTKHVNITAPDVIAPPPPTTTTMSQAVKPSPPPPPPHNEQRESNSAAASFKSSNSSSNAATPEYPNMECPPIFEPETYSLTDDANVSLTLLLRRTNSSKNSGGGAAGATASNNGADEKH